MSAPQFTPGPWRVEDGTTLIWGACNADDTTSYGMGVPICEARHWQSAKWERERHPMTDDEIDANARLIAAAPRLYELLERALWVIDKADVAWGGEPAARALLAEIRGEQ